MGRANDQAGKVAVITGGGGVLCAEMARVNAIAPGFFVTEQDRPLLFGPGGQPSARAAKIRSHPLMARFGETRDLTGTLLWLTSEAAAGFVNGIVVPADGGFSACSGV